MKLKKLICMLAAAAMSIQTLPMLNASAEGVMPTDLTLGDWTKATQFNGDYILVKEDYSGADLSIQESAEKYSFFTSADNAAYVEKTSSAWYCYLDAQGELVEVGTAGATKTKLWNASGYSQLHRYTKAITDDGTDTRPIHVSFNMKISNGATTNELSRSSGVVISGIKLGHLNKNIVIGKGSSTTKLITNDSEVHSFDIVYTMGDSATATTISSLKMDGTDYTAKASSYAGNKSNVLGNIQCDIFSSSNGIDPLLEVSDIKVSRGLPAVKFTSEFIDNDYIGNTGIIVKPSEKLSSDALEGKITVYKNDGTGKYEVDSTVTPSAVVAGDGMSATISFAGLKPNSEYKFDIKNVKNSYGEVNSMDFEKKFKSENVDPPVLKSTYVKDSVITDAGIVVTCNGALPETAFDSKVEVLDRDFDNEVLDVKPSVVVTNDDNGATATFTFAENALEPNGNYTLNIAAGVLNTYDMPTEAGLKIDFKTAAKATTGGSVEAPPTADAPIERTLATKFSNETQSYHGTGYTSVSYDEVTGEYKIEIDNDGWKKAYDDYPLNPGAPGTLNPAADESVMVVRYNIPISGEEDYENTGDPICFSYKYKSKDVSTDTWRVPTMRVMGLDIGLKPSGSLLVRGVEDDSTKTYNPTLSSGTTDGWHDIKVIIDPVSAKSGSKYYTKVMSITVDGEVYTFDKLLTYVSDASYSDPKEIKTKKIVFYIPYARGTATGTGTIRIKDLEVKKLDKFEGTVLQPETNDTVDPNKVMIDFNYPINETLTTEDIKIFRNDDLENPIVNTLSVSKTENDQRLVI